MSQSIISRDASYMHKEPKTNSVTLTDYKPLKKEYNKAVKENKKQFNYKGNILLTDYAKYLLQYMETKGAKWVIQ